MTRVAMGFVAGVFIAWIVMRAPQPARDWPCLPSTCKVGDVYVCRAPQTWRPVK